MGGALAKLRWQPEEDVTLVSQEERICLDGMPPKIVPQGTTSSVHFWATSSANRALLRAEERVVRYPWVLVVVGGPALAPAPQPGSGGAAGICATQAHSQFHQ